MKMTPEQVKQLEDAAAKAAASLIEIVNKTAHRAPATIYQTADVIAILAHRSFLMGQQNGGDTK